ncbi:MAG: flagellar type III secretion system pore protein FliP [Gemmatimonadetes bacterium]|nr:flagellar type III secretion system pore protein FliP [Gemmatimonadota bacterium]
MVTSLLGVLAVLALVLGLLVLSLRFLRRFVPSTGAGHTKLPLEVVQRLSLSPKQGIAIVRIGERLMAVSMGDGGVRALAELDAVPPTAAASVNASPVLGKLVLGRPMAMPVVASELPSDFRNLLRTALRGSTTLALVAAVLVPVDATAQAAAPTQAQLQQVIKQAVGTVTGAANGAAPATGAGLIKPQGVTKRSTQPAQSTPSTSTVDAGQMITKTAPTIDLKVGGGDGLRLSGTVGVVVMMGVLTLLPTLVLMMTGFTRILVVLHFLRQAIGTQSAPPAQLIAALALLITGFVMAPTLTEVNQTALQPWMDGRMEQAEMLSVGVKPFKAFMLRQVRPSDVSTFARISGTPVVGTPQDIPLVVLVSAFVTSEMRTAFQIGFALFLPFIVIDVVVASVLMSMGMMMLPPAMISLPFKLLLFVLVDGWALIVTGLVQSFH